MNNRFVFPLLVSCCFWKATLVQGQTAPPIAPAAVPAAAAPAAPAAVAPAVPAAAVPAAPATEPQVVANKSNFQVGVGLGISTSLQPSSSYVLTAPNYYLQQQQESSWWPVASVVLCYNPSLYYIKRGDEDKSAAEQRTELKASRWAGVAALNLSEVFNTTLGFNQHTSLGLGIGRRVGEGQHFYFALFLEGSLSRFLRDSYSDRIGNTEVVRLGWTV